MAKQQKVLLLTGPAPDGKFVIESRDVPHPGPGYILVEVRAAALNPVDWILRDMGLWIKEWPTILGTDAAGVVVELGEGVSNVAVGDRVMYMGTMVDKLTTFQQYNAVKADFVAKIPDSMTLEQASTIPLTVATAALGLYDKRQQPDGGLGLTPPWTEGGRGKYSGQSIFIAGGATGVGQHTIELAKMSGFSHIIATASLHNEAYLKSLGATHVLDRKLAASAIADAVKAVTDTPVTVAYDAVSDPALQNAMYDLLAPGGCLLRVGPSMIDPAKLEKGDKYVAHVFADVQLPAQIEVGRSLYAKLPEMLAAGDIKPTKLEVLPDGLAGVPAGLDRLKAGVSAVKFVVRPQETP
ncbi:zinc-binding alcohol dehydrogenase family protein [Phanerochaete sordida]|uniref:Zinc-binding alcohol dehydrogenase family protein n=1 Tax=Phanerochaete sordida TaxID=48140 RepID=A0A9P3G5C1_9APHY|nr:zinc-binding alcohol dehydrogenase family protein [Phanerochaete sordida]